MYVYENYEVFEHIKVIIDVVKNKLQYLKKRIIEIVYYIFSNTF